MRNITAVILYCSFDKNFLSPCITNLLACGIKCIVVTRDIFYGGGTENVELLEKTLWPFIKNNDVKHVHVYSPKGESALWYEADARVRGTDYVTTEYVLYIDVDEIVAPGPFSAWLDKKIYQKYTGMKFRMYAYAYTPNHQLDVVTYSTVMCKTKYAKSRGFRIDARLQYFNNKNKISRWLSKLGLNPMFYIYRGTPFIHHYTGARSMKNMKLKVENWSHKDDRTDWWELVQQSNKVDENNRIGGYKYKLVPNYFNINL